MSLRSEIHPRRKILVAVTIGESSNSGRCSLAPHFAIVSFLKAQRIKKHSAHTADVQGPCLERPLDNIRDPREGLVHPCTVVSVVHIVGRAITPTENDQLYLRYSRWDNTIVMSDETSSRAENSGTPSDQKTTDKRISRYQSARFHPPLANMWPQMPWKSVPNHRLWQHTYGDILAADILRGCSSTSCKT